MRLSIEIEPGSEPIRGVVDGPGMAAGRAFTGWIELAVLIDAARVVELEGTEMDGIEMDGKERGE